MLMPHCNYLSLDFCTFVVQLVSNPAVELFQACIAELLEAGLPVVEQPPADAGFAAGLGHAASALPGLK